jgi:hypothetical protein
MEQIKDISSGEASVENNEEVTWEMIMAKGKEADAAWREVERIMEEMEKAADETQTPDNEVGRAALAKLFPEYQAADAKERALEDERIELMERYIRR